MELCKRKQSKSEIHIYVIEIDEKIYFAYSS